MFIFKLTYRQPIEEVENYLLAHKKLIFAINGFNHEDIHRAPIKTNTFIGIKQRLP
ncbi:hypothetical protein [Snodgrassella communis]|uniref:hypothetical protein n=1 Tax=Snodgrassella communis TaxID=2946699 RepID=UPI0015D53FE3|nr:hypothetical protein [Snodgrassella communis]